MKKNLYKIIISGIIFLIGIICEVFKANTVSIIFLILSYLIVGGEVLIRALVNIFHGKVFDENFLMALATVGAIAIGEYPEAVGVMLFYQVGELFQSYAVNKSRNSISELMDIRPDYANVVENGEIVTKDPYDVERDDIIVVKAGEKIPLDGIVIEGDSSLNTVALTGESAPVDVSVGSEVLSGSVNINGLLKIKVTSIFENSTVSRILDLVENATNKKSKSENFISKFATVYTPIVVLLAVLIAFIPPIFTDYNFKVWIYRAFTFLVVSCPCALVISIPLSFFGGIGAASKNGILIKGSNYLEATAKADTIIFDKTGTLTEGVFEVQTIYSVDTNNSKVLKYAAYAESYSNHPIAESIKKAYNKEIDTSIIEKSYEKIGYGVIAYVDGKEVICGNLKLMEAEGIKIKSATEIGTTVYVAVDHEFIGYIVIADIIKPETQTALELLKESGIKNTVMLTGDSSTVAENVGKSLGIDRVYSQLLPTDKVERLEEILNNKTGKVIFVGDGVNDAPVLARADIGIAMGGVGSDAAIEASDIVLMTDELSKIPKTIKIARKTLRIVNENIVFALTVKILVLILTALGYSSMWAAVFADVGVSVIAIINALRTLRE